MKVVFFINQSFGKMSDKNKCYTKSVVSVFYILNFHQNINNKAASRSNFISCE
jgi:hypothetical protein